MENMFNKSRLAAAVGAAALALAAAPASAVVVVGGDNGWEVSFDGNVNLFYTVSNFQSTVAGVAGTDHDSTHMQQGLLPAFFSTTIKSPTVNGLTGTARISFAPDSSSAKNTRQDFGQQDMREVLGSVSGSFGTVSFGRTLGLMGRQAILNDQTLFGVGATAGVNDGGGTTLGRIGYGYVYPQFRTRFAYATPNMNGFTAEIGLFDPMEPFLATSTAFETDMPRFEGEVSYATAFSNGSFKGWVSGMWQEMDFVGGAGDSVTSAGVDVGAKVTFGGFHVTGTYYTGKALGMDLKMAQVGVLGGAGTAGVATAAGYSCTAGGVCDEADNDGFYVQGGYTFAGKTMVAASYGETNQDSSSNVVNPFNEIKKEMWTVGVYHDVTPWLKVIGEYSDGQGEADTAAGARVNGYEFDVFSVGAFVLW